MSEPKHTYGFRVCLEATGFETPEQAETKLRGFLAFAKGMGVNVPDYYIMRRVVDDNDERTQSDE